MFVANFFNNLVKAIPALVAKIGTILLLLFTVGLVVGYFVATAAITPFVFLIPVAAMFVMWYRLDEGVLVLVLLGLLVVLFPELVNDIFSSLFSFQLSYFLLFKFPYSSYR